jgi:hypothetical protein
MRYALPMAVAAAVFALAPIAAQAAIECKPGPNSGSALTQSQAIDVWHNQVVSAYGAAWADWGLATAKTYDEVNLGVAVMHFVSARACRTVPIYNLNARLLSNQILIPRP